MEKELDSKKRTFSNLSETSASSPVLLPPKVSRMNSDLDSVDSLLDGIISQDVQLKSLEHKEEDVDSVISSDTRLKNLEDKVDEVLNLLKKNHVTTTLDVHELQDENKKLKLRLQESEGTIVRLSKKVNKLEATVDDLKIHSMKPNLIFHNIPESHNEDCYEVISKFLKEVLQVPEDCLFTKNNPGGEVRVDISHRIGQRKGKARPLVATFVTRRGRDLVFSFAKKLKATQYAITEQLPPSTRERRAAQVPSLIQMRNDSKASGKDTTIKLIHDKLIVDKVNSETFHSNPID